MALTGLTLDIITAINLQIKNTGLRTVLAASKISDILPDYADYLTQYLALSAEQKDAVFADVLIRRPVLGQKLRDEFNSK